LKGCAKRDFLLDCRADNQRLVSFWLKHARKFVLGFPDFSSRQWGDTQRFRDEADRQHFIDGYVKAGLPR
jgi:hypothetical protein